MKKYSNKILITIGLVIVLLSLNYLIMFILYKFGGTDLETRKFNMLISGMKEYNVDDELAYALQWYGNWDNMFLTNHFKNKYRKRKNILSDVSDLENISGFFKYDYIDGEKLIGIAGDVKRNLFEMLDQDYIDITREYYFRYQVDENGYLDDVELVGQQDFDALTGFPIGVDDSKYHTIS